MKNSFSAKWWIIVFGLLLVLLPSVVYAQTGNITVNACTDQNANGDCADAADSPAPLGVEACLNDTLTCQPAPATFSGLAAGSYTPFLRFTGASQGYYPTTPRAAVSLAADGQATVTLGAVYPVHPKGVAVHAALNKVYVAFQGPVVMAEASTAATQTVATKPYPFVAVIDGTTDEVLRTIPGGPGGIGRGAWGVAVSGDNVYVGAFEDGLVSVIDAKTDTVIANVKPDRSNFQPTSPAVNPLTGWVHFPDYTGGRVVILDGTEIVKEPVIANQFGFSPFELVIAKSLQGYAFVTLRDAIVEKSYNPNPFLIRGMNSIEPFNYSNQAIILPYGQIQRPSGSPYAIGLWQDDGMNEPRLFITYADDTRSAPVQPDFINPNKMLVYSFSAVEPKNILLRNANIKVGDYAEAGLVYNPATQRMLGTYAGFPYKNTEGDAAACNNPARGGTYALNSDGGVLAGDAPGVWRLPAAVVGNPPLSDGSLQWKNPFELAVNPNNGKVYVTDRCWSEFPGGGGQPGGGAVLIFYDDSSITPQPTSTPTPGGPTSTPTITPTPGGPTTEPTVAPITLAFNGPAAANPGDTFSVAVEAQGVTDGGVYGAQLDITYDPAKITVGNVQVNADLPFVIVNTVDPAAGKIKLVASRQGEMPGLTGNVTLLTFQATAAAAGSAAFAFENQKLGNPEAIAFTVIPQSYTVSIGAASPTTTPTTAPTSEPTATPTTAPTSEGTATPTIEPTATPTTAPTTEPTATPTTAPTTEPTITPTTAPTSELTPTPTSESGTATMQGQVTLPGQSGDNSTGATITIADSGQNGVTDAAGHFSITGVAVGAHTSITADAPGYLPAICATPVVSAPTTTLAAVSLRSGDVNDDNMVDITDAAAVGLKLGETGTGLSTDINRDNTVDILDIILVSINFGQGSQTWNCLGQ